MSIWENFKQAFGIDPISISELKNKALRTPFNQQEQNHPISSEIEITEEYKKILEWLKAEAPIVFVSGKAGTGKTTFIRHLREAYDKNLVVVAPTGVAALNIEGVTIHSFFMFPPRVVMDDDIKIVRDRKFYTKISLLIIDEVSMVRGDIIDAIDKFLRKNRGIQEPFGGVQVLLIGDLFQLPPVVNKRDYNALQILGYESPYFFSAKAFEHSQMVYQELTKIFRQSDASFIDLLNRVRNAEDLSATIKKLNERFENNYDTSHIIITLTATNKVADQINDDHLNKLPTIPITFTGEVSGKFSVEDEKLPSPINLTLKEGAQIMFTKNDGNKKWVNGTIGKIVGLNNNTIQVEIKNSFGTSVYDVQKAIWKSYKYEYDDVSDKIVPVETGRYIQFPLMLAWAVTIHKSQGKTLEKVLIDLGTGAFDYGQVYVALSRCRSLEDIHLNKPIKPNDIKCDPVIKRFYDALNLM